MSALLSTNGDQVFPVYLPPPEDPLDVWNNNLPSAGMYARYVYLLHLGGLNTLLLPPWVKPDALYIQMVTSSTYLKELATWVPATVFGRPLLLGSWWPYVVPCPIPRRFRDHPQVVSARYHMFWVVEPGR